MRIASNGKTGILKQWSKGPALRSNFNRALFYKSRELGNEDCECRSVERSCGSDGESRMAIKHWSQMDRHWSRRLRRPCFANHVDLVLTIICQDIYGRSPWRSCRPGTEIVILGTVHNWVLLSKRYKRRENVVCKR